MRREPIDELLREVAFTRPVLTLDLGEHRSILFPPVVDRHQPPEQRLDPNLPEPELAHARGDPTCTRVSRQRHRNVSVGVGVAVQDETPAASRPPSGSQDTDPESPGSPDARSRATTHTRRVAEHDGSRAAIRPGLARCATHSRSSPDRTTPPRMAAPSCHRPESGRPSRHPRLWREPSSTIRGVMSRPTTDMPRATSE